MRALISIPIVVAMILLLSSCGTPPNVAQGKVVSCDAASQTISIQDESKPGTTLEMSFKDADMGTNPVPGDKVRIAYQTRDGKLLATRIMKIAKQK